MAEPVTTTPKLDRLARSLPDARAIAEELTRRQVRFSLGGEAITTLDSYGQMWPDADEPARAAGAWCWRLVRARWVTATAARA